MKNYIILASVFIFNLPTWAQNFAEKTEAAFKPATHTLEVTDILPTCAQFIKSIEACVPKIYCRIRFKSTGLDNSYTYAVVEKAPNNVCRVIFSAKEITSTFVSIFDFSPAELKSVKKIVETFAQSKGKFQVTNVDNCCNKNENAKEVTYCKITMREQTIENVFASSSHYTCKGKVIKPIVEKEFRYSD